MSDFDQYARHFSAGMKVGVGIPLPNAEVFRDWGIIRDMDEDLVTLQLSRDTFPEQASLHIGHILQIRGGADNAGFCVRAIIVDEGYARELMLRFIGEVVSDELREFYRIDAFLPVKYYLSHEQRPDLLEKQWHGRRLDRLESEQHQRQQQWGHRFTNEGSDLPNERYMENQDDSWQTIVPLAANISGGGIRIMTHQGFTTGEYVLLEIYVPSPRHIVDAVARVAFANPVFACDSEPASFDTGLQFVYIHEHDRDAIIKYISGIQLDRIRQMRHTYLADTVETEPEPSRLSWQDVARRVAAVLVVAAAVLLLAGYLRGYMEGHPKNEIGEIFENGIRRYMEQRK